MTSIARLRVEAPPDRGRLLTPADVARKLQLANPESKQAVRWVREHVPNKKRIGKRLVRWWEKDVDAWIDEHGVA